MVYDKIDDSYTTHQRYGELTPLQREVVHLVIDKSRNVFFTGSAGTGKSFTLRFIIELLRVKYGSERVAVCALTGLVAMDLGGDTLHSFASLPLLIRRGKFQNGIAYKRVVKRWKTIKVLVIDEISMIDGKYLAALNRVLKVIRGDGRPFGGVKLIMSGDFLQLPPVSDDAIYCFQHLCWDELVDVSMELKDNLRQSGDYRFYHVLNRLRVDRLNKDDLLFLKSLERDVVYQDGVSAMELFSTRAQVDVANNAKLNRLTGPTWEFNAVDSGSESCLAKLRAPPKLLIRLDCQVMYVRNNKRLGLVNGSVGVVKLMCMWSCWVRVLDIIGGRICELQVMELLVLLLRIKDQDKILAMAMTLQNKELQKMVQKLSRVICYNYNEPYYPIVKFHHQLHIIKPELNKIHINGKSLERIQLPLTLSWAISIHKSQGQTIERLKVDGSNLFEKSQLYVALSRVVSSDHLQIVNMNWNQLPITVNKVVLDFYRTL